MSVSWDQDCPRHLGAITTSCGDQMPVTDVVGTPGALRRKGKSPLPLLLREEPCMAYDRLPGYGTAAASPEHPEAGELKLAVFWALCLFLESSAIYLFIATVSRGRMNSARGLWLYV